MLDIFKNDKTLKISDVLLDGLLSSQVTPSISLS